MRVAREGFRLKRGIDTGRLMSPILSDDFDQSTWGVDGYGKNDWNEERDLAEEIDKTLLND
ncbi:hypothetical protein ElP_51000 [Tautonia plasticadhaerens]|uniref:Uncharacterized protein n=1 Tax=Tautonia plasticadhaerens TaxID=2527974 RepID=A0A518H8J0_9BACT|nr:hypothetical protein ElP_51000 [Tautonia plasticadhaerens]